MKKTLTIEFETMEELRKELQSILAGIPAEKKPKMTQDAKDRIGEAAKLRWQSTTVKTFICVECGESWQTKSVRKQDPKFCSAKCKYRNEHRIAS